MSLAAQEMRRAESFHGYGDVQGERFLRKEIAGYYRTFNVGIEPDDVFISVDYKGDTVQPFDENDKNRCVIIDGDGSHEETKYE